MWGTDKNFYVSRPFEHRYGENKFSNREVCFAAHFIIKDNQKEKDELSQTIVCSSGIAFHSYSLNKGKVYIKGIKKQSKVVVFNIYFEV